MKGLTGCIVLLAITASCVLFCCTALYAAGGLAAARTVEPVPFIGPDVSKRVENWVLGATEELTITDAPLFDGIPFTEPVTLPFTDTVEERPECKQPKGWPAKGPITQGFHVGHSGIDIALIQGTLVQTTMCGTVVYAGWNNVGYGYLLIVENSDYKTYYAHLSQIYYAPGDQVNAGTIIGASGSTGNSTGPHLHYEVRLNGVPQDPWPYIKLDDGFGLIPRPQRTIVRFLESPGYWHGGMHANS